MTRCHASAARILLALALLLPAAIPGPALAETTCSATMTDIDFGSVTAGADVRVSADITYTCETRVGAFAAARAHVRMCLAIGAGTAPGSTVADRRMAPPAPGGPSMAFQLYRRPGETAIWGDSPSGGITWEPIAFDYPIDSFIGIGGYGRFTGRVIVHGHVPAPSLLPPGTYMTAFPGARIVYRYSDVFRLFPRNPTDCQSTGGGDGGANATFNFEARARIASRCTVQAGHLDFGNVPGLITRPRDQTSVVELECTPGSAYQVGLDMGRHSAAGRRRMQRDGGTDHVAYALYSDPGRLRPWGNSLDIDTVSGTGTGIAQQLIVHGRIPAGQVAPAGGYRDVVTVIVTY